MANRAPITQAEKQYIQERKITGESLRQISEDLHCSIETVRKWWRCGRDQRVVRARGRPRKGALSTYASRIADTALALKRAHPHWGAQRVKLALQTSLKLGQEKLPSSARLAVLFRERCPEAIQKHERRMLPPPAVKVSHVHQRWQMDAKEGLCVGSERVNLQEIVDVYSGLRITSQALVSSLPTGWRHLTHAEHQQVLRLAFCQWGRPEEVQTDHDPVFVNPQDPTFPSLFTLWLVGLEITHVLSRPHRPTDQAQIERSHRTQGDFVWKDQTFEQVNQLQQALDEHCQLYNQAFPSQAAHCQGRPPLLAFPSADATGRPYHPDLEWDLFDLQRVDVFLAQFTWTRKVAKNGIVFLGTHYYYLGRHLPGQSVSARFLPASRAFRFQRADGETILDLPAQGLEKDHIIGSIPAHLPLPVGFQYALPCVGGTIL
jgi:transposase InsO family protein